MGQAKSGAKSRVYPPPPPTRLGRGYKRGAQLFVKGEQVFDAVPFAGERLGPVTAVHDSGRGYSVGDLGFELVGQELVEGNPAALDARRLDFSLNTAAGKKPAPGPL